MPGDGMKEMREPRRSEHRHKEVQQRDRERHGHQGPGHPDRDLVALIECAGGVALHPALRGHLKIFPPQKVAVEREEDEGRERDHERVDRQRDQVRHHDHPEEAQRIGKALGEAEFAHRRQRGIMLGLDHLGHVFEKEAGKGRSHRNHQEHRGKQHDRGGHDRQRGVDMADFSDERQRETIGHQPADQPDHRDIDRDQEGKR